MSPRTQRSTRIQRRQDETRARLIAVAARRFAAGVDSARLEEIADEADVARATLYNLFGSKEALVAAVLAPLLDDASLRLQGLADKPAAAALRGLVDVYVGLFRDHRDALRVSYQVQEMPLGSLAHKHVAFVRAVVAVLERAASAGLLHGKDAGRAARALSRTAIPLLEVYGDEPEVARAAILGVLCRGGRA